MPTPVVALNRAVAVAMAGRRDDGMAMIEAIERGGALSGYHLLPSARADLLRRAGEFTEAEKYYQRALELCSNTIERRYIEQRLRETRAAAARAER
jgi:RNA polymerase sigma-70 factor (ECF subfamily)